MATGRRASGSGAELIAQLGGEGGIVLARLPAPRRFAGAIEGARSLLSAGGAHEDLPHANAAQAAEEVGVLLVEGTELSVGRLGILGRGDGRRDDGTGEAAAQAAILADEPQLETALHEKLLVDQPVENVAPILLGEAVAAVGVERRRGGVRSLRCGSAAR